MKLRAINEQDYELILDLDRKVYPTSNPVQLQTIKKWFNKNPEFGMIYEENGKILGVCIVIPLNKVGWEKLIAGELSESELSEKTLFDEKRDKEIGLHIYHIEKLDKNIKEFYKTIFSDLSNLLNKKILGFSALCVSDSGKALFNKLGFIEKSFKSQELVFGKRAEMRILYPNENSIVWNYLNNKTTPEQAILKESEEIEGITIKGYDFNQGVDWDKIINSYSSTGFQASNLARAIEIIREMRKEKAFIYLGYTSNMISCGLREIIRYLAEHKLVDIIVTTAGGIEEDFIKCLGDFKLGSFSADGSSLREKGINRIGNIFVPNSRYVKFEKWILPILEKYKDEQLTPRKLINILGREINNKDSVYYWAYKNNIPVFCPAIMDGSLGDMIYFFKFKNKDFKLEITEDAVELNNSSINKSKTGMIILGGGVIKHSICNANLYRNGADYAVYVNSNQEFDGSDSGASIEEAKSWGKIKGEKSVKVTGDASILFPIIAGKSFVD